MTTKLISFSLLLTLALFAVGCESDNTIPDDILYHDIQPDTTIQSIVRYSYNNDELSCGDFPVPNEAALTYFIDMNNDSINDFQLTVGHVGMDIGSPHCLFISYSIGLFGLSENNLVSRFSDDLLKGPMNYTPVNNAFISPYSLWNRSAILSGFPDAGSTMMYTHVEFTSTYIGVKVNNNIGWIQVAAAPNNGIIIKDFALNLTENNSINAGQTY
jgi:hypothetical protein